MMTEQFTFNPKLDFAIERFIDAPPRLVWEALTKPEHLKEWYMPREWGRVARAETRTIPTIYGALSLLTHLKWGIQVKLDLGTTVQMEKRERGWVTSFGFLPILGLGWQYSFHGEES